MRSASKFIRGAQRCGPVFANYTEVNTILKCEFMKRKLCFLLGLAGALVVGSGRSEACTGITLRAGDGSWVLARTIEWGGSNLNSRYVIVPRGYEQTALLPNGAQGMRFAARYGYVGFAVEADQFVAEGLNEAGLSAGLFYFPGYGSYVPFEEQSADRSIADLQLVPWLLGHCATVEEAIAAIRDIRVVGIDPRASTVHWRIADKSGRQVVLEIVDGVPHFYENELGVLTNSPGFEWQMTNLNNYVNLVSGGAAAHQFGRVKLAPFGAGSGSIGLPGDVTPPSRFVRAAFYQTSAPQYPTGEETVVECFQILNNFDIPIGVEFAAGEQVTDIPSATQWTSATDITNGKIYYRTMYDSAIRSFDLNKIRFDRVKYQVVPLDTVPRQPIVEVRVK